MSSRALYPGSFDPLTLGHVDIIRRGLNVFDHVVVAVVSNPNKATMFTVEERVEMIEEVFAGEERISIDGFSGLLVAYAQNNDTPVILRGLRAVADFEYEYQMASMNRSLAPGIETVFLMAEPTTFFVSSRLAKEVARLGGDISHVVPPTVFTRVHARLAQLQS
ncbi:MAG: pantetheine-phosphate adenylyltransferase [Bradymonadia bacterium]|jgi:pantetheine-phosphate adenylyltransferase